jgi:hypothetical protein
MEINALTAFSDLDIEQAKTLVEVSDKYGVSMIKMVDEITSKINGMDAETAARSAGWYFEAHEYATNLADKYNVSVSIAAGVISAVSPRMPWLRNKTVANAILREFRKYSDLSAKDAAKEIGMALGTNVTMAISIARSGDVENALTGIKRRSFYNNIIAPMTSDAVTVDTWMMMCFVNTSGTDKATALKYLGSCQKSLNNAGAGYIVIAESVREVARAMNLYPSQVQALYWVAVSGDFNGGRKEITGEAQDNA